MLKSFQVWKHVVLELKDITLIYDAPASDVIYKSMKAALYDLSKMDATSQYSEIQYYFIKELEYNEEKP